MSLRIQEVLLIGDGALLDVHNLIAFYKYIN